MICHIHFTLLHLSVEMELKHSYCTVESDNQALREFAGFPYTFNGVLPGVYEEYVFIFLYFLLWC